MTAAESDSYRAREQATISPQPPQPPAAAPAATAAAGSAAASPHDPAAAVTGIATSDAYEKEVQRGYRLLEAAFAAIDAGEQPDMESLRGLPGVLPEPIPYDRLKATIADGSERALGSLGRSPLQLKAYWNCRDKVIKKRYASVADYLYMKIFGFDCQLAPDGRKVAVVPPSFFITRCSGSSSGSGADSSSNAGGSGSSGGGGSGGLVTAWTDNDFPYNVAADVTHYNLWANRPLTAAEVERHIQQQVPPGADYCWFVNPPAVMSVPAIWHCHILVQQPQQQPQQQQQQQGEGETAAAAAADS